MSDTSKVKHWSAWECEEIFDGNERFVLASDHDRIVAELKTTIARQTHVIEELMEQISELTMDEIADRYDLEAIEQGEGTP